MKPAFGRPELTRPPGEILGEEDLPGLALGAIPALGEPPQPDVEDPVDDPLVALDHERIADLRIYARAGWTGAVDACWLRAGVHGRLVGVAERLPDRWGLAVFDAWRPLELQAELFAAAYADPSLPPGFVSEPDPDPTTPPPHLTGGTVDLTLTFDGVALAPGGGFDDFTGRARADALESTPGLDRDVRRLLYHSMADGGFVVLACEWWHYEFGTRRWAAITGARPLYGPARPW